MGVGEAHTLTLALTLTHTRTHSRRPKPPHRPRPVAGHAVGHPAALVHPRPHPRSTSLWYPRARPDLEARACSLPACAHRFGSWRWDCPCLCDPGSPGPLPGILVNFGIPLNFGVNFLGHRENYRHGKEAIWPEGVQVFNLKGT